MHRAIRPKKSKCITWPLAFPTQQIPLCYTIQVTHCGVSTPRHSDTQPKSITNSLQITKNQNRAQITAVRTSLQQHPPGQNCDDPLYRRCEHLVRLTWCATKMFSALGTRTTAAVSGKRTTYGAGKNCFGSRTRDAPAKHLSYSK